MISERNALYAERGRIKKQLKEVETVKGNVDRILGFEEHDSRGSMVI